MPLTAGTRLGSYEIVAPLGAGGMGEVYRARDTRLGRDVALKVLPDVFAADPDRLARFEREAQTLAALNHPNILMVFDVGEAAPADAVSRPVPYVVTELLEGATLRERLTTLASPMSLAVRKAVDLAVQMASGLAAAHAKGVVHRDLKPENVFVTAEGRVKLLDFGLARTAGAEAAVPAAADTRLAASGGTEPGVVLGSVGYMSPEQVRGEPADARSDIFGFGAVLYEMLTGRRAFRAGSAVETMHAILQTEPPAATDLGVQVPVVLERIITRCLEKQPAERFQSASDLAFALETAGAVGSSPAGVAPPTPSASRRSRRRWLWAAAAAVAVAGLGLAFFAGRLLQAPPAASPALSVIRLTYRPGNILTGRFTPDGGTVVYGASWSGAPTEIFTARTQGGESQSLGIANANVASVSPQGELAILRSSTHAPGRVGMLARMPLGGGTPRDVLADVLAADWTPDGEHLAVVRRMPDGKTQLEFPIGHELMRTPFLGSMRLSPDGRLIAAVVAKGPHAAATLVVLDAATGAQVLSREWGATAVISSLAWAPSSRELFVVAGPNVGLGALRALTLDGRERIVMAEGGDVTLLHDVSKDGRLLIERATSRRGIAFGRTTDARERDLSWLDGSVVRALSDDGAWMLFTESLQGGGSGLDLFLRRTDGAPPARLGEGIPEGMSGDAKVVLVVTSTEPPRLVILPTGAGSPRPVDTGDGALLGGVMSDDGTRVYFAAQDANNRLDFFQVTDTGEPKEIPQFVTGPQAGFVVDRGIEVGPDGTSLARVLPDGRIGIRDVRQTAGRVLPGPGLLPGEQLVQWSGDGHLYVADENKLPAEVYRIDLRTGLRQLWRRLMPADPSGVTEISAVCVARDGRSYAYTYRRVTSSDLYVVDGAQDAATLK